MGHVLDAQGVSSTPIDKGFGSVLKLIQNTNADSFDLFYGLYKFNRNSCYTVGSLRGALSDVVGELLQRHGVVGVFNNGNRQKFHPTVIGRGCCITFFLKHLFNHKLSIEK